MKKNVTRNLESALKGFLINGCGFILAVFCVGCATNSAANIRVCIYDSDSHKAVCTSKRKDVKEKDLDGYIVLDPISFEALFQCCFR